MAKVEINTEAPAEATKVATPAQKTVTDTRGRVITIAEPDFLAQFRLTEAVGGSATNEAYMNMVRPLLYVKAIDGDHVFAPNSKREVEALIQRLGADGYNALAKGLMEDVEVEEVQPSQAERLKK